ncbi:MAG: hypothetical protein LBJ31_04775 [Treponema sp.]|jgi:YbbR domain-containing protein|nr:hypothetical protein [Treponema sp.]
MDWKKLAARLTQNWPAKVLSVVAALFLFAFHRMGDLQERHISVPLNLEISGLLVPSGPYPRNIRITLRGDATTIYPIAEDDIEAFLDLTHQSAPGIYRSQVQIQKKGTAAEAENLEITIDPMEIEIDLDTRVSKAVPVTPGFQGYLANGFELISYSLDPNSVVIDGPQKQLSGVAELTTDAIDLRGRNSDFNVRVRINNPNPLFRIRGDGTTEFNARIRELILINSFDSIPVTANGLAAGLRIAGLPRASIRIEGVQNEVEALDTSTILSIDCSSIGEAGEYTLPVSATLDKKFLVSRIDPGEITIQVTGVREDQ